MEEIYTFSGKTYIFIPVQGTPETFTTNDQELDQLQERVGGYIEGVDVRDHILYCNDRGLLDHLPLNLVATGLVGRPILGNAVLVGPVDRDGETGSCSRAFIQSLTRSCPMCRDSGWIAVADAYGEYDGVEPCTCPAGKREMRWRDTSVTASVDDRPF